MFGIGVLFGILFTIAFEFTALIIGAVYIHGKENRKDGEKRG